LVSPSRSTSPTLPFGLTIDEVEIYRYYNDQAKGYYDAYGPYDLVVATNVVFDELSGKPPDFRFRYILTLEEAKEMKK